MAEPFLGEMRMFGFDFPPRGWAKCDGALLPINQHGPLYSLLGTAFGGDGRTTFGLPDMRGRVPLHEGSGFVRGQRGGVELVVLKADQLPAHSHAAMGTTATGNKWGGAATESYATSNDPTDPVYRAADSLVNMHDGVITPAEGGGQPHNNVQPINVVNFSIALEGLFPPRN
jgi:microcystin-dependent protein